MVKYVRIIAGEYAGRLGTVDNQSSSGKLLSIELDIPDGPWDGILVGDEDVHFLTRKEYFAAKLYYNE
jgi:hypothetical protein